MPEGNINAEIAEKLRENGESEDHASNQPSKRRIETIEILEAARDLVKKSPHLFKGSGR